MPQNLPTQNASMQQPSILAPTIAPPAVPKKRRRKLAALIVGALCGLCLSMGVAWYVHRFPKASFPHAGQDDYAGLPALGSALDATYGDIRQGVPTCPNEAALAQTISATKGSFPSSGVLTVEGVPGVISYRIEEHDVVYGARTLSTNFLFVTNETYRTLRITHRGNDGTELSSIPVLPSLQAGIIWIGADDPDDGRSLVIETLGDASGAWPQNLPPELVARCPNPFLEVSREERSVSLSFDKSDFEGGFTLVYGGKVFDLSDGEVSDTMDENDQPQRTITYHLSSQDFQRLFPSDDDYFGFSADVYLSGVRIIYEGGVML